MDKYIVTGGTPLYGEIDIHGAKNAALPILAATFVSDDECIVHNCPAINDVAGTTQILKSLGCKAHRENNTIVVNPASASNNRIEENLMGQMRSSVIFLGAILSKMRTAKCSYPGGCEIGSRPIDLHLKAFRNLGVEIIEEDGFITCQLNNFKPGKITLSFPSVGATENIMLLSCREKGRTVIVNAAREPEVVDLQNFLNSMGAKISGAGSSIIEIEGAEKLHGTQYSVIPDRIAAETVMFMTAAAKGELIINNMNVSHTDSVISILRECGADIHIYDNKVKIKCLSRLNNADVVQTMPYPGFPTDAQSQLMAAMATMRGTGVIKETIFENRFNTVSELKKMGADITVHDRVAVVKGVRSLRGASVKAPDLRGGASLVIAALGAQGTTEISNISYIDRGYENLDKWITKVGGNIKRVS